MKPAAGIMFGSIVIGAVSFGLWVSHYELFGDAGTWDLLIPVWLLSAFMAASSSLILVGFLLHAAFQSLRRRQL